MVYYVCYFSTAIKPLNDKQLEAMLKKTRKTNSELGLTGMLIYIEGTFIQMIEGDKDTVEKVYKKISLDNRHKQLIKVISGIWVSAKFDGWSMGFYSMKPEESQKITGYKDLSKFYDWMPDNKNDKHPAIMLLQSFYANQPLHQKLTNNQKKRQV